MRDIPGLGRLAKLEELGRASRARCIVRWQALGLSSDDAVNFADDPLIGAPNEELQQRINKTLHILIGELGAGKSLLAERIFQNAIVDARENIQSPIPVYFEATTVAGKLVASVQDACDGLGNFRVQGVTLILDGADEIGIGAASDLLAEARFLIYSWKNSTVIITSRPLSIFLEAQEAEQVPLLSEQQSNSLIGRFAGQAITDNISWSWPLSVKDAVRRPLFALLMGLYLKEENVAGTPKSTGVLLEWLIQHSLGRAAIDTVSADRLLQKLAVLCIERKGPVPSVEIANRLDLQVLLNSRLIVEQSETLAFPLAILAEWFAAQALASGLIKLSDIHQLEHWRYSLIIFVGTFSHEQVSRVLVPLAEKHPAFAADIVNDGLSGWGLSEEFNPPPPIECGQRIRTAMLSWASGLEPLTKLLTQFRKDGKLRPIGTQTHGSTLTTSWYFGDEKIDDVILLPSTLNEKSKLYDWPWMRWARPGRQSAWAWRWALEEIVKEISNLINNRKLPLPLGPLTQETIWKTALTITGHGSLYNKPISLSEIEQQLSSLSEYSEKIRKCGEVSISLLRSELSRLHEAGKCAISSPWPGPDLEINGGLSWEYYSDDQILSRTKAVFGGALSGYQQLVDNWFSKCSSMMATAVVLPARLIGVLTPPNREKRAAIPPVLDWYLEALPLGSQNIIDISFADGKAHDVHDEVLGRKLYKRLRSLRPDAAECTFYSMRVQSLRIFGPDSATSLALGWLWDDLRKVSLVNGVFNGS